MVIMQFMLGLLVALVGTAQLVASSISLDDLVKTLNDFGHNSDLKSSGLTYEDLVTAHNEVLKRGPEWREAERQLSTVFRLIDDFVFLPMESWKIPAKYDDSKTKKVYVRRAERGLRMFWPAYVDGKLVGKEQIATVGQFSVLVRMLRKLKPGKVTPKLVEEALKHLQLVRQRCEQIVRSGSVYVFLAEYEVKLNFLNNVYTKALTEKILPQVMRGGAHELTEESVERLIEAFEINFPPKQKKDPKGQPTLGDLLSKDQ